MPRLARLDPPGVVHHIIIGGIEHGKISLDNKDRAEGSGESKECILLLGTEGIGDGRDSNGKTFKYDKLVKSQK